MRTWTRGAIASLVGAALSWSLVGQAGAAERLAAAVGKEKAASCGNHGTAIEFVSTPKEAAERAKEEEKLVFVLHISGHFEDPALT